MKGSKESQNKLKQEEEGENRDTHIDIDALLKNISANEEDIVSNVKNEGGGALKIGGDKPSDVIEGKQRDDDEYKEILVNKEDDELLDMKGGKQGRDYNHTQQENLKKQEEEGVDYGYDGDDEDDGNGGADDDDDGDSGADDDEDGDGGGDDGLSNTSSRSSDNANRFPSFELKVITMQKVLAQLKSKVKNQLESEQRAIEEEEDALGNSLDKLLEKCILTVASFFISFHVLLANSQQSSNDLLKFVLLGILILMIWAATIVLLAIWWFKIQGVEDKLKSLGIKQKEIFNEAKSQKIQGIHPHLKLSSCKRNLYKSIVIFLGIFATVASIYFGSITYTLWSIPGKSIKLPFTQQGFADQ